MRKNFLILTVCYLLIITSGCNFSSSKKNVNINDVKINFHSIRFDQELYKCDTIHLPQSINELGNKYPDFTSVYFNELTGFQKGNDTVGFYNSVKHFLTYKDYVGLYNTIQKEYANLDDVNKQLEDLFKHIKYYFPARKYGTVYYFTTGLNNWKAITVDTLVGVGLDMFLGANYPFYPSVQLPKYQIDKCEKQYIPTNVAMTIYENEFPYDATGKTLLDLMIIKGKQLLFTEYMLPTTKDELIIGYSPSQLEWCQKNEAMIWNFFAEKKLLYSTQWQDIMQYVNDGPTSMGMPAESPGNIASWIGWQIVRNYLKTHNEATLKDVLENKTDSQTFMRESGYKPR